MGSPVSVVIAEIVMQTIENQIFDRSSNNHLFWYRYVDDIISCVPKVKLPETLQLINSINPAI